MHAMVLVSRKMLGSAEVRSGRGCSVVDVVDRSLRRDVEREQRSESHCGGVLSFRLTMQQIITPDHRDEMQDEATVADGLAAPRR